MRVTHLGHAGFCLETPEVVIVMDPWMSPHGAFDSGWFQFPRNHHLAAFVEEKLADPTRERFVYISHEHQDHFDIGFMRSIRERDFTLLLPKYRRDALRGAFDEYACNARIDCRDGEVVAIPGGHVVMFLDDSELNRDSAILVAAEGHTFLNLNDCNLRDALPGITRQFGPIDTFTCQFSGATWHPTCYEYDAETYGEIARQKIAAKFRAVVQSVRHVAPRVFVPAAGPPCFLDPLLFRLNLEPVNIFPRNSRFLEFASRRLASESVDLIEMGPGDVLDVVAGQLEFSAGSLPSEEDFPGYVEDYASHYALMFAERDRLARTIAPGEVLGGLEQALAHKLTYLAEEDEIPVPLYVGLIGEDAGWLRVDFPNRSVYPADAIDEETFYEYRIQPWQALRLLQHKLTWEEVSLSFRVELRRRPDRYWPEIHGFLLMEPPDLPPFFDKLREFASRSERVTVEVDGKEYSILRSCPHQGGDLSLGWCENGKLWTCPRHGWQFDLTQGGRCTTADASIQATLVEDR